MKKDELALLLGLGAAINLNLRNGKDKCQVVKVSPNDLLAVGNTLQVRVQKDDNDCATISIEAKDGDGRNLLLD